MKVKCPNCNQEYEDIPEDLLKQEVQCESCNNKFKIHFLYDDNNFISSCPKCGDIKKTPLSFLAINCQCNACQHKYEPNPVKLDICAQKASPKTKKVLSAYEKEQKKAQLKDLLIVIFGLLFFGGILFGFGSCVHSCNKIGAESRQKEAQYGHYTAALAVVQEYIEKQLKAPATAKITTTDKTYYDENPNYKFSGYVDAQNSFGAIVRTYWSAEVKYVQNERYRIIKFDMR